MEKIRDLLARDLTQRIEDVITLTQQEEHAVYTELTEYVVTDRIREQYRTLLRAIADAPTEPHEGIGVWVSGFFGSGKSSFVKNLGYVVADRTVLGQRAADLFKARVQDEEIAALIDNINARIPTEVIMFDISVDRAVRTATERVAEVMYTVLLRELDYAEDFDVAELEIELEAEGRLAEFVNLCGRLYRDQVKRVEPAGNLPVTLPDADPLAYAVWQRVRKGAQKIQRASTVLHHLDPATYPTETAWAESLRGRPADITVARLVERTFELASRRRPGRAVMFIIDEVGQYVARSADKILDLQAVVREFGPAGRNRVLAGQAVAPVWVIVTAQEKLDEVVAAIDSRRVELAKLQDSFRYRIDMAPADIREVATRRVLAKKPEAEPVLQELFKGHRGQLNTHTRLERTALPSETRDQDFVQFYPYLPHYIGLSIDIMSGIRLQPGAPRHLGGSNRTIIKQTYEMLVSDRTRLADAPVGTLATLDKIYELVEGNLPSEKQKDISDIAHRFGDAAWEVRVAKAIALLEFVRDVPRTTQNLAAVLYERLGDPSPQPQVEEALRALEVAQFVRLTEDGWKLLTVQEKNWQTERNKLDPRPAEEHEILRQNLAVIFSDPGLKTYRHRNLRNFRVGVLVDGKSISSGELTLHLLLAEDAEDWEQKLEIARTETRSAAHQHEVYWVALLTPEIEDLVTEVYRSNQMIGRYEQLRAQNQISSPELASLEGEKQQRARYQERLQEKLVEALERGTGLFRGVSRDGAALGRTWNEIFSSLWAWVVPDIYPKLEAGVRRIRGTEAEEILKAANLNGLPPVFYDGPDGLNLVVKRNGHYVPNLEAEVAREVLEYLKREHAYGNKVTGRTLEEHFGGVGYGWDRDVIRLVMATLLRAGAVEVTHQGRRFRVYTDPQARAPFASVQAFRAASFAPREAIDVRTLARAARHFEDLTGEEVDVEEAAIAEAFQRLARTELEALLPVEAAVQAHRLPANELLQQYRASLETVLRSPSDDVVRILAGEGHSLREMRNQINLIRRAISESNLAHLRQARATLEQVWPALRKRGLNGELANAADALRDRLESAEFYRHLPEIADRSRQLIETYHREYARLHEHRNQKYVEALEQVKGRREWAELADEALRASLLKPLESRICRVHGEPEGDPDLREGELGCRRCQATLEQMESDLLAVQGILGQTIARLQELATPQEQLERVRVRDFFDRVLENESDIEEALERLRDYLLKRLAAGVKVILE